MEEHAALVLRRKKLETWHRNTTFSSSLRLPRLEAIFKKSFRNFSDSRTDVPKGNSNRGDTLPFGKFSLSYIVVTWTSSALFLWEKVSMKRAMVQMYPLQNSDVET